MGKKIQWCCEHEGKGCKAPPPPPRRPPKVEEVEEESLPPAPPPLASEAKVDPIDEALRQAVSRHLQAVRTTEHHHEKGAWLYGDYKEVEEVDNAPDCAKACHEDEGCFHWNFHVQRHRCSFKGENAGFNSDHSDYIGGNAKRYSPSKKGEL